MQNYNRECFWDNIKGFLIILVVFAHVMEWLELDGIFMNLRGMIYSFHMPLFVFISGYFSKNIEKTGNSAFKNCLIPFFIFNTLYLIILYKTVWINIFTPIYLFWYLFSLFTWRILLKYVIHLKHVVAISILIGLYIGLFNEADRFLGVSRTIAFFPFFLLGYYADKNCIQNLRNRNKLYAFVLLTVCLVLVFILSDHNIPIKALENIQSYQTSGITDMAGAAIRLFQYVIATVISICLIWLFPDRKGPLSTLGERTITVFILSAFLQRIIFFILTPAYLSNLVRGNIILTIGLCLILTTMIVYLGSLKIVVMAYRKLIDFLYKIITT